MTEQKAKEIGKALYENITLKGTNVISVASYIKFVDMAIKALEKQIPKKPFKTMDENNPYYKYMPWCCPCCRETLYEDTEWGNQEFDYCTECGQKLDWGDE